MKRFIDFFNELNEDKIVKRRKMDEQDGGPSIVSKTTQNSEVGILNTNANGQIENILKKGETEDFGLLGKKQDEKEEEEEKKIPVFAKPLFKSIQSRPDLSVTVNTDKD